MPCLRMISTNIMNSHKFDCSALPQSRPPIQQKRDSIRVRNNVFSCFVINYSLFKRCLKIGECYSMGQWHKNKHLQPICWKHLLCFEISADVYTLCVFSGHVVNFQPKHTVYQLFIISILFSTTLF